MLHAEHQADILPPHSSGSYMRDSLTMDDPRDRALQVKAAIAIQVLPSSTEYYIEMQPCVLTQDRFILGLLQMPQGTKASADNAGEHANSVKQSLHRHEIFE